MSEHYTKNTEDVTHWCNKCGRPTQHRVSAGRLSRCMEHDYRIPPAVIPAKDWPDEPEQLGLFPPGGKS